MGSASDGEDGGVNADYALASFQEREGEYVAAFERFLAQCYAPQMRQLFASLSSPSSSSSHSYRRATAVPPTETTDASQHCFAHSLRICAQLLIDASPRLAALLFRFPDEFLPLFHRALAQQLTTLSQQRHTDALLLIATLALTTRQKLKIRVEFLPPISLLRKPTISTIRSSDVKRLVQVAGTVVRTGMIKMQESSREVTCASAKCQYRFLVTSDMEQGNILEMPRVCPSDRDGKPCKSTQFTPVESSRVVSDHQVIKIQEQVSKLGVGSIPRSILVVLEEDLVDSVKAGDHVVVVGVLMRSWKPCIPNVRCDLETMVRANSIRVQNASSANVLVTEELKKEFTLFWKETHTFHPMRGRNEIVGSICPKVYGLFVVKLALALTIIGGCSHVDATGMKTRGEPHLLVIGDPGTGKSQFLRFAAELSPRSVLTTGIGTTSAGLTCTAVKDGSEWMLEAGALVLADRGVCCIDEFSSMRSHDRASIHEAMEQQTLSVAKAGLVCKLNARTTVFAVTNPKGQYDPNADVSVNTSIASPLLSRFDLILVLLDRRNNHWDQVVSAFILEQSTDTTSAAAVKEETNKKPTEDEHKVWGIPKLQAYICHVKDTLQPRLSRGAMSILQRYYQVQRAAESRSAARTTIRLLESLTRLAQAHARLMFHDEVEVGDAVVAVFLMEVSKAVDSGSSMLGGGVDSALHSDFAEDPEAEYALQERLVLEYLGLTELATRSYASGEGSGGGAYAGARPGEEEEEEEREVYVPSSMKTTAHKRPRESSRLQWQQLITNKTPRWGTAPPSITEEVDVAEDVEDEYYRQAMRMSQAENESKSSTIQNPPPPSSSQSLWQNAMGQARVQRWSQLASQQGSGRNGGGRGGGGPPSDDEDPPPPVTSKWWQR